jgi:lysophospholipase L1-like esterase
VLRSALKKIKKVCRKAGVHSLIGKENVVPIIEYEKNIREMIELALPRTIFLIDTIPNQQQERNSDIRRYNTILDKICKDYDTCRKVNLYDLFENKFDEYYQDATHCNQSGCERIAEIIHQQIIIQY